MAKAPKKKDLAEVHARAMERADEAWQAERENIRQGRDCQRFYAGDQWDAKAKADRESKNRPVLTINRLPQFVKQMTGDLRKNPPSLKFLPAKGGASQETAEALNGIARNIEQQSNAKDCYVIATENAAVASQGAFRVVTEYSDDDGFEQDIRIRPIRDPFGFLLDPYAQLPDKSDARYGFVFEHLSKKAFEQQYPDATMVDFPIATGETAFPWQVGDSIRIAEYWERRPVKKTLLLLSDGSTVDDEAKAPPGLTIKNRRDVQTWEVCMYITNGVEVLSGPHKWPGRFIPICVVVGEEITIDGTTVRKGMVNDARDAQKVYNYSRTASVEAVALQPKAPFVATVKQVAGYEAMWATAGSENHSTLIYNADPQQPGAPQRSQPPIASQGLDVQALTASEDLKAVVGIYDASLGARSNETSGRAIAARQMEGDTATYLYPDNLSRALGYLGRILADLIPRVYDTERQVRILKEDGTADMVMVNATAPEMGDNGQPKPLYDLSAGEYDVTVTTGPSFASRRAEASAHMTELVRAVPQIAAIAGDLVVKNMDFPGADEIAARIERSIPPGVKDDGPQEPPPPNPKEAADAIKAAADADKTMAETVQINLENAQMFAAMQAMGAQVQQLVAMVQGMQQGGGQGQQPPMQPPEAPPQMPPDMAALPPPDAMPQPNGADMPPMIELETLNQ